MFSVVGSVVKGVLPDWPEWAVDVLLIMSGLLIMTLFLTSFYTPEDEKDNDDKKSSSKQQQGSSANGNGINKSRQELHKEFDTFRHQYILVYLVIMLADWMQGTHMYTLYLSYGVNISALFLTGFLSGACFAPFLGSAVDKYGRKMSCIVYCVLEVIINLMEHSTNFQVLLVGRILGGISTNLLFSAFESWMTTEHRRRGFPEEWLARTYSEASMGNGAMAILAGIVAQVLEDYLGHIGPFQGAIALTVLALVLVAFQWEENYGEEKSSSTTASKEQSSSSSALVHQFLEGWKTTVRDSNVWRIGLTQALSEGAMYTFVFMWVPTLLSMDPPGGVPTGCVFSAMMMAITIGGVIFPPLLYVFTHFIMGSFKRAYATEACASFIYFLAGLSMAVPAWCLSSASSTSSCLPMILASFMSVEMCVGLFMPVAGTLRSSHVPDALQGAILNIFRLPLNAVVVSGTYATDVLDPSTVFSLVSVCFMAAALLQVSMVAVPGKAITKQSATAVGETKKSQ